MRRYLFMMISVVYFINSTIAQTTILFEDFSDNHRKWDEDTTETEVCYIKNGKYHIKVNEVNDGSWHWFSLPAKINDDKNWIIESTIYLDKMETDDSFFGICWGADDAKNMMQVVFYPKSKVASSANVIEGEYYRFIPLMDMDSLTGNKIKFTVLKAGKKYYCLMNGMPYGKASANKMIGNKIGFLASGKTEIEVDDFVIKEIESNNPLIQQIRSKFSTTEERLVYYEKNLPWTVEEEKMVAVPKEKADTYRIYTIDDNGNIIGYVKEYDAKTNKLIHKFQAKKISETWTNGDILDGEYIEYNEEGNIEYKAVYFNPDNMQYDSFLKTPTTSLYKCDSKERVIGYKEIKDGELKREIEFDENGVIEKATNTADIYHYERNNFGHYDKVFEEDFNPPLLDWPAGEVSTSISRYTKDGYYTKAKNGDAGRSCKVAVDYNNSDFSVGVMVDIKGTGTASVSLGIEGKGMNYTDFAISDDGQYTIFNMYNGIRIPIVEWTKSPYIRNGINALDIVKIGKTIIFSIGGTKVKTADYFPLANKTIGLSVTGIGNEVYFSNMVIREIDAELPEEFSKFLSKANEDGYVGSGTGFFISNNGYLVTNNHVIENAKEIYADFTENGITKTYRATLVKTDSKNDLAILKINKTASIIPYSLNVGLADVGTKVFALGYPYALTYLGKEIKFTEGSISSKTGYGNDINTYQISVPVQPGNSGGPLFDNKGNLVGVVNAKFTKGDNVSYAIKSPILKSFLDLNPNITRPTTILKTEDIPMTDLIKRLEKFVVLIKIK